MKICSFVVSEDMPMCINLPERICYITISTHSIHMLWRLFQCLPIGKPKWTADLHRSNIDELFGFIEAFVILYALQRERKHSCPDKKGGLIFPTGKFLGVYFSEELKYAQSIGYTVIPIKGYLYEKGEGFFYRFVTELSNNRLKAKKEGNSGLSYVYKILMNSLYGRFGINPLYRRNLQWEKKRWITPAGRSTVIGRR